MKSGDVCEQCRRARLCAVSSRAAGDFQVRYLRCPSCGASGRSVVKADLIRRRGTDLLRTHGVDETTTGR
jgi:hypothetical protein